ncbi:MAG: hypothetical protein FJ095_14080 [Deltaproteobacteria bacterium]|nr:hypothetical protein [Deltaproteobacteria bacterium]
MTRGEPEHAAAPSDGEPFVAIPDGLLERLDAHLVALARAGGTTTYLEVARALAVPPPHHLRKLILALEALATRDHAGGAPILAALVTSRVREGLPAPGFFAHLAQLGGYRGAESGPEARRWHEAEVARVVAKARG